MLGIFFGRSRGESKSGVADPLPIIIGDRGKERVRCC